LNTGKSRFITAWAAANDDDVLFFLD